MFDSNFTPPLQAIIHTDIEVFEINLFMLRIDLNHPTISGNKLYKLKYNIEEAKKLNKNTLLTFGGAFSNHIAATAAAGKGLNLKTIGIIRGDELSELNQTLQAAKENGMHLHFVSRELYRDKHKLYKYVEEQFSKEKFYLIPEGGSNELGVKGCMEIVNSIPINFDTICCACGTGATFAGITMSLKEHQKAIGFQVLKANGYIKTEVEHWFLYFSSFDSAQDKLRHKVQKEKIKNWIINEEYHFGRYAKTNAELISFVKNFEKETNISLEPIYTGKMMFGIFELMKQNYFKKGETIIAVHTGGLQSK